MKRITYILFPVVLVCSLLVFYLPSAACQPAREEAPTLVAEEEVLNLYGIDPLTLDPAVSREVTSNEYVIQLFSGLVRLDDNLKPAPDIAQSWQVSNDGRTYPFYIPHGVRFHSCRGV